MRILVVNDDGVESEGIKALARALSKNNEIVVFAPDGNRSAFSHSLTLDKDLIFRTVDSNGKFPVYSLSGTPADCVKFALHYFENVKFDMVCSGINHGNNLGSDTLYSGTVSAGIEANYFGIPSIAFSNVAHGNFLFDENIKLLDKIFDGLCAASSPHYTLNVNFPNITAEQTAGVRFAPLGHLHYSDYYEKNADGSFRLKGEPISGGEDEENDVNLSKKGFVTVTPISYNRTAYGAMEKIKEIKLL